MAAAAAAAAAEAEAAEEEAEAPAPAEESSSPATSSEALQKLHHLVSRPWFPGQLEQLVQLLADEPAAPHHRTAPSTGRSALHYAQS